jgi:hypothetical protein
MPCPESLPRAPSMFAVLNRNTGCVKAGQGTDTPKIH